MEWSPQALWNWQAFSLLAHRESTFCFIGNLFIWIIKDQSLAESMNINRHKDRLSFLQPFKPGCPEQTVSEILFEIGFTAFLGLILFYSAWCSGGKNCLVDSWIWKLYIVINICMSQHNSIFIPVIIGVMIFFFFVQVTKKNIRSLNLFEICIISEGIWRSNDN